MAPHGTGWNPVSVHPAPSLPCPIPPERFTDDFEATEKALGVGIHPGSEVPVRDAVSDDVGR